MSQRLEASISGVVQGVAFRWYAQTEARRLGLVGTVANLPDGSVQLVAEGDPSALEQLRSWLAVGSPSAEVDEVATQLLPATGEFHDFSILRNGARP